MDRMPANSVHLGVAVKLEKVHEITYQYFPKDCDFTSNYRLPASREGLEGKCSLYPPRAVSNGLVVWCREAACLNN